MLSLAALFFIFANPSTLVNRMVEQLGINKRKVETLDEIVQTEDLGLKETTNMIEDETEEDDDEQDQNSLVYLHYVREGLKKICQWKMRNFLWLLSTFYIHEKFNFEYWSGNYVGVIILNESLIEYYDIGIV